MVTPQSQTDYQIALQFECDPYDTVDVSSLMQIARTTLQHQGIERGSMTIVLTDDETVRALNKAHRGLDEPTDILSFPFQTYGEPADNGEHSGSGSDILAGVDDYLGDLIIAIPYTRAQAAKHHKSLASELELLVVHGVLHLLGYDHATEAEESSMWALQDELLVESATGRGAASAASGATLAVLTGRNRGFLRSRLYSFRVAVDGAVYTLRSQPNSWIELAAVVVVIGAGWYFQIAYFEWALLALAMFLVIALEAVNTAVETVVDMVTTNYHPRAKLAKDTAAGALVFGVICSLCVGSAIFGPKIWQLIFQ